MTLPTSRLADRLNHFSHKTIHLDRSKRMEISFIGNLGQIPPNAQVVLQVEGEDEYNEWSGQLAERQREEGQQAIYVKVKGLKPAKSRLIKPEVAVSL